MTEPVKTKFNRASFSITFGTRVLDDNTTYDVILRTRVSGYIPAGLTDSSRLEQKGKTVLVSGKGKDIEALETDDDVLRIEAPIRHHLT